MSDLTIPALVLALLLVLGPIALIAGARLAAIGSLALCALGSLAALAFLLRGAAPVEMAIPFGLAGMSSTLALDGLSGIFLLLLMLAGCIASAAMLDDHHQPLPTAAAFPVFIAAMMLTLLAGDAIALVVGFELMSLASFILVVTAHRDEAVQAAGRLYLGMAGIAAICLISALALMAGHGGSFAAMRAHPPEGGKAVLVLLLALIGPGSKAGLAPLHVWLPPAHASAPGPVSALMSGAMTKVAIYVLIRLVFDLAGPAQPLWWAGPLLAMGMASAVLGAFRANMETDIKSLLACSTIENIGLITIGLGLAMAARAGDISSLAGLAMGATLLHVMAHGLFKTLLFITAGAIQHNTGTRNLARLGGLAQRMPITAAGMLLGAASLAAMPLTAGFASEWLLFQSVLAAVRLGGMGLQILVCLLAATLALATALAACAAVRLVGTALLGRPRSLLTAQAVEAATPLRWAVIGAGALILSIGLFPAFVLRLAGPAIRLLTNGTMSDRADALLITPSVTQPGYAPLAIALLLAVAAIVVSLVLRAHAVQGHRTGPAWDCGFGPPPDFLPFGDPLTEYSAASFAQPLRRILGPALLAATAHLDMPKPGDTRPAVFTETTTDPAITALFSPLAALRAKLSRQADRAQFLTIRQILAVMTGALILFLAFIALVEQL